MGIEVFVLIMSFYLVTLTCYVQPISMPICTKIAKKYEVVVLLVAHPRKSNGQFKNDSVSGSADITNAVDFLFHGF